MADAKASLGAWIGLSDFCTRILGVSIAEIATIKAMQADMAATISRQVRDLGAGGDERAMRERLAAVVSATQVEDHLRQRLEHVEAALTMLEAAIVEEERTTRTRFADVEEDRERFVHLGHGIVDSQTLGELRAAFATALGLETPTEEPSAESGEVDLF